MFIPRPVIAAAVDEEGRGELHAAGARAGDIRSDTGLRDAVGLGRLVRGFVLEPEVTGDHLQVFFGQGLGPRHQRHMRLPEMLGIAGVLGQLGGAARYVAVGDGTMAEDSSAGGRPTGRAPG